MSRHANFGAVVSISEGLANEVLSSVASNTPSLPFNVQGINIGGVIFAISGGVKLLAPPISLHQRADNLVTTNLSLQGTLTLTSSLSATEIANVTLSTAVDVPLGAVVLNNQVFGVLNMSQIAINQLSATFATQPVSVNFANAVASPGVLAAVTNIFRQFPLLSTPALMSSTINQPISRGVSYGQAVQHTASRFPPYPTRLTLSLSVGKIVIRPFEGALTVAADFDGITSGDSNQIVNLLSTYSPLICYVRQTENDGSVSFGAAPGGVPEHVDMVVLINAGAFSNVFSSQVSPAFDRGPCIDNQALVHSISIGMGWFDAGAPFGTGYGLTISADASLYTNTTEDSWGYFWPAAALHTPASLTVYARMVAIDRGGGLRPGAPSWSIELVNASAHVPDWLPLVILVPMLALSVLFPAFTIFAAVALSALKVVVPDILSWADSKIMSLGASALSAVDTPVTQSPFFLGSTWNQIIRKLGFSSEGAEAQVALEGPTRVSSLRQNLKLRHLNAAGGLRVIRPPISSVRRFMGS